jgi:hypothetical protein
VFIYDNEPRSKEIISFIEFFIDNGNKVVIWPQEIQQKEIGEMIESGMSKQYIQDIINERTFSGLKAKLEFNKWKKI